MAKAKVATRAHRGTKDLERLNARATERGNGRQRREGRAGASGHNGARAEAPPIASAAQDAPTPKIKAEWQALLRPLTDRERKTLTESIKVEGVLQPILVDERGYIIDGMHRWQIAQELGEHCPRRMVEGLSEDRKAALVVALNAARRQLTAAEIKDAEGALADYMRTLRAEGASVRQIAQETGKPKSTVQDTVKDVKTKTGKVNGMDGRKQPARKPKASKNGQGPRIVKDLPEHHVRGAFKVRGIVAGVNVLVLRRYDKHNIAVDADGVSAILRASVPDMRRLAETIIAAAD